MPEIDLANGGKIVFNNLDTHGNDLLQTLQDIQPPPSAIAFEGVGGIGDQLQLAQHELRDHHHAVKEPRLRDVSDTTVDNHAGI